ncbi:hypothetical protein NPIL_138531 [Nephila pilipes]|uniref:Uncharacterized protein n=1 Tax=Nephila pilipes TaxID=299642 RepID=A0A8X6U4I3_NEPPI|nr:hypothetical protein NPIL_138531 [Nephila pilipes]
MYIDIRQLPPKESGCLINEKDINEDIFESILPAYVGDGIGLSTKIDNNETSYESAFDPEVSPGLCKATIFISDSASVYLYTVVLSTTSVSPLVYFQEQCETRKFISLHILRFWFKVKISCFFCKPEWKHLQNIKLGG